MDDDMLSMLEDLNEGEALIEPRKDVARAAFGMPGGKHKSIQYLLPHLPYRKKWIDHFAGTFVVTLNRQESTLDVCNDRYSGITSFYRCLQNKEKIEQLVTRLRLAPSLGREEFYHCKNTWCDETDDVERAAKWYYMMRCSVIGKGDVFARSTNARPPIKLDSSLDLFWPIHYRLRGVIIENLDFEQCFNDYDSQDTVHYFDPPYLGTDTGAYRHGGKGWNEEDLTRLLKCIRRAKGFCALSGYMDERIDKALNWTDRRKWKAKAWSEVNAFTEENNKKAYVNVQKVDEVEEVLWIKE